MENKKEACVRGTVVNDSDVVPETVTEKPRRKISKRALFFIRLALTAAVLTGGYFLLGYLMDLGTLAQSYTFTKVDGGYEISAFSRNKYSERFTRLELPDSHEGEPVVAIGELAFKNCLHLVSVTIPDSVTVIDVGAFLQCESLESVVLPERLTHIGTAAFGSCKSLKSVILPEGLTHIDSGAFSHCESLTSIDLPDGLTEIAGSTFSSCIALESVSLPESITAIGDYAFKYCHKLQTVDIPDSVEKIDSSAFSYCRSLSSVYIPAATTQIGEIAFQHCSELTAIDVHPDNPVYSSQDGVLFNKDMTQLITYPGGKKATEYTVPDSVIEIHTRAFLEVVNLERVTLHDGVADVGTVLAFCGCTALEAIIVSETHPVYSSRDGVLFSKDQARLICYPSGRPAEHYDIPQGVTSIAPDAFTGGSSLKSVSIPEGVTVLENNTFFASESIEQVRIPESLTKIEENAFLALRAQIKVIAPHEAEYYGYDALSSMEWVVE